MAAERSNGVPGGAPVRPIPPHECPYSSMLATEMCTKAVRRRKLIGAVGNDEFTIALVDVGQKKTKKCTSHLILSGYPGTVPGYPGTFNF